MKSTREAIMPKRENILVLDVETAGGFRSPVVYDLGFTVVERRSGRIIERHSLVIADVFYGMKEDMRSAYYADKLPEYHNGIRESRFEVVSLWAAWRRVRTIIAAYGIKRVYAYNANFDKNALNNTMRVVTAGKYHNFMPRGIRWCCIWHMACQTILSQPSYRRFAEANGLVSEHGNLRTSAEAAYAYIIGEAGYSEPHIGIEDAIIETEILHKVIRQHRKVDERPKWNAWTIPQKT
jgi:hypothetical protein